MFLELVKPVALLLCMLSLVALFHTAFLIPGAFDTFIPGPALHDRIIDSLLLLVLSAAISIVSGLLFRDTAPDPHPSLSSTLPLRIFYWCAGIMVILFILSWYLQTNCIFYRSTARW